MSYTVAQLRSIAEQAAGGPGKIPSGMTLSVILTAAIDRLCNAHAWGWLRIQTTLALTSGQSYVSLPAGFAELDAIEGTSANLYCFRPVTLAELLAMRAQAVPTAPSGQGQVWYYAIDTAPQAATTAAALYRLEVFPTPTQTEAGAIALAYRKRPGLPAADSDVVDVPATASGALLACVRYEAAAAAIDGTKPAQARYEVFERQAQNALAALIGQDGRTQTNLGSLIPGRLPQPRPFDGFPVTIA